METPDSDSGFARLLRYWREVFGQSQEELALSLESSPRHISRLENGRVRPSRVFVEKLTTTLSLGERDSQQLLFSAGFSSTAGALTFEDESLAWFRKSVAQSLALLSPAPALVFDDHGRVLMINRPWLDLFSDRFAPTIEITLEAYFGALLEDMQNSPLADRLLQTRCGLLMTVDQEAVLWGQPDLSEMMTRLASRYGLPKDWRKLATQYEPDASWKVPISRDGEDFWYTSMVMMLGARGPVTYVARPRLTLQLLIPDDHDLNVDVEAEPQIGHPLLCDHFLL